MKLTRLSAAILVLLIAPVTFASQSAPVFSPYADVTINTVWDPQYQDMEPMDLAIASQSSSVKSYHLAFITDAGACQPAWGGQAAYTVSTGWAKHLTDRLRDHAIDYVIAFGGASGADISSACSETQLLDAFNQVIGTYQPKGLDFDIENGSANVGKLINVLAQLQKQRPDMKISFTLPVMPEGLTGSGQDIIRQAQKKALDYSVNIMAMDYGPAYPNDMGQYAVQAAQSVFAFLRQIYPEKSDADLWRMVEVTPMIGVNDVNVEQFTLENVDTLRNFARQNSLGGLSIWSVARDNPCPDKWASPVCSGNNLQRRPYEFSQRFMS